jgi:hypothetical protein
LAVAYLASSIKTTSFGSLQPVFFAFPCQPSVTSLARSPVLRPARNLAVFKPFPRTPPTSHIWTSIVAYTQGNIPRELATKRISNE